MYILNYRRRINSDNYKKNLYCIVTIVTKMRLWFLKMGLEPLAAVYLKILSKSQVRGGWFSLYFLRLQLDLYAWANENNTSELCRNSAKRKRKRQTRLTAIKALFNFAMSFWFLFIPFILFDDALLTLEPLPPRFNVFATHKSISLGLPPILIGFCVLLTDHIQGMK